MRWRDIRFEKPTVADADEDGAVLMLHRDGKVGSYGFGNTYKTIAWMPLSELPAFIPIPDPPDGWRFVEPGEAFDPRAKFWSINNRWVTTGNGEHYAPNDCYIVPIDPPEPKYRPFANAAEFEPYKELWVRSKNKDKHVISRVTSFSDWGLTDPICPPAVREWIKCFNDLVFADGTPFGVRVDQ